MSISQSLKERLGPQVRIQAISLVQSGSAARFLLRRNETNTPNMPQAGEFATAGRPKAPPLAGVTRHPKPEADRPEGGEPLLTRKR